MSASLQRRWLVCPKDGVAALLMALIFPTAGHAEEKPGALERHWFAPMAGVLSAEFRENSRRTVALESELVSLPPQPIGQQSERLGWHTMFSRTVNATKWLQLELDGSQAFDAIVLVPVDVAYGAHPGPGYGFPKRFRLEASDDPAFSAPRLLAAFDDTDFPNPGDAPVFVRTPGAAGRFIRITATRLWQRDDLALLALGEVMILRGELNIAAGRPVTASDSYDSPPAWQAANATDSQSVLGPPVRAAPSPGNGWHSLIVHSADVPKWVQIDLGQEAALDDVRIFPARPKDFPARSGFGFPLRFRVETANDPDFTQAQMLLDQTGADFINPGENPVVLQGRGIHARYVRMTATRLWERSNDFIFALSELQVYSGGKNVALGAPVSSLDSIERGSWSSGFLGDGFNSQHQLAEPAEWLRDLSRRRETAMELTALEARQQHLTASLARTAMRWIAGSTLVLIAAAGVGIQRVRRVRRREVERLRQSIAGDLHDEIGSNLGSIALLSEMALRQPANAHSDLLEINRVARETAASMRDIVWLIQPGARTAEDLIAKLRETAGAMLAGMEWKLECQNLATPLSLDCKRHILLIFKEALHNIRKHAAAHSVAIRLTERGSRLEMEIRDDGAGFDPEAAATTGHGLPSLRHRAQAMGGELSIDSSPGSGAKVRMTLELSGHLLATRS